MPPHRPRLLFHPVSASSLSCRRAPSSYNREGDLLFSSAKDGRVRVWFSHNGERIGSYDGHNGTVWCIDVRYDSTLLISGSADNSCSKCKARHTSTPIGTPVYRCPGRAPCCALLLLRQTYSPALRSTFSYGDCLLPRSPKARPPEMIEI